jgi:hypothetical protein
MFLIQRYQIEDLIPRLHTKRTLSGFLNLVFDGIFDPIITRTPLGIILLFNGNMFLITLKENGYKI